MAMAWKTALAGAAAVATVAFAPAAHAAATITYTPTATGFVAAFSNTEATSPNFADSFTPFTVTTFGYLSGTISETFGIDFTLAQVEDDGDGSTVLNFFPLNNTDPDVSFPSTVTIGPGTYQLFVSGTAAASGGSYAGTLGFAAVPEPATWAMLLLGFGAIGFGMRRRKAVQGQPRMRVHYA